jgi:hypothetical protein
MTTKRITENEGRTGGRKTKNNSKESKGLGGK